ncbi:unnamed protein product [Lactuca virosa]|uniref:Uncharacterized protein n=1 Tax=Lactuca virosa TaxID=75947 RepID=A0AAU9PI63_9ASTR|nr:unnamed protein product [Lactuca virosa]
MPCLVKRNGDDLCALFKMLLSEGRFHAAMVGHFPVVVIGGGGGGGERLLCCNDAWPLLLTVVDGGGGGGGRW